MLGLTKNTIDTFTLVLPNGRVVRVGVVYEPGKDHPVFDPDNPNSYVNSFDSSILDNMLYAAERAHSNITFIIGRDAAYRRSTYVPDLPGPCVPTSTGVLCY